MGATHDKNPQMHVFVKLAVTMFKYVQNGLMIMFNTPWTAFLLPAQLPVLLWFLYFLYKELIALKLT